MIQSNEKQGYILYQYCSFSMIPTLSRRDFLRFFGSNLLSLGFLFAIPKNFAFIQSQTIPLGRTTRSLNYYDLPSYSSKELGFYNTDTIVNIIGERLGDQEPAHNPLWYQTEKGWIHSAYVQPVKNILNEPVLDIPPGGMLCEVTVPFTQAWIIDNDRKKRSYRFYYGSTHWISYAIKAYDNSIWYRIVDDYYEASYMAYGRHFKPVLAEEMVPISALNINKKIEIDLVNQKLVAFENDRPIYMSRIATGYFEGDTPIGEFSIERKQPSRHMVGGSETRRFDLPGVPWVCFISWTGVSIHGTYWHNNYGTPQSHGCINLPLEAAKWVYRWTLPEVPVNDDYVESEFGTKVVIQ